MDNLPEKSVQKNNENNRNFEENHYSSHPNHPNQTTAYQRRADRQVFWVKNFDHPIVMFIKSEKIVKWLDKFRWLHFVQRADCSWKKMYDFLRFDMMSEKARWKT